jgi:predicted NUDIX family NTP pyrophosphohydrolase
MIKKSAGILLFRERTEYFEVLLVHPGGPFWAKKDEGAWSIPKGELEEEEDPLKAAIREVNEETGMEIGGDLIAMKQLRQPGGKIVYAWAAEGDFDAAMLKSNTFSMEWPPKSGLRREFPEVDRAAWFTLDLAKSKIHRGQVGFIDQLQEIIENRFNTIAKDE